MSSGAATTEIQGEGPRALPGFVFRHFLHEDARFGKLKTREDPHHIHKTLGILSILSFFYRYGYVYPKTGTLGFDGKPFDWATMSVHTLLAFSSIIFKVPRKRINTKPMVIYEEYRQHAMVFTFRCFVVFCVATLLPEFTSCVAPVGVLACHLLVDRITAIWGTPGNTAVRATSGHMKLSNFYRAVSKLYSLYQFLAIASHILPNARLADLGYNAIIAIQSSAFMMTLYRKRIIRGRTHMVVYAGCLVLSAFHIVRNLGMSYTAPTIGAFVARINIPRAYSNKYVIWSLFLVAAHWSYVSSVFADFGSTPLTMPTVDELSGNTPVKGAAAAAFLFVTFQVDQSLNCGNVMDANPSLRGEADDAAESKAQ